MKTLYAFFGLFLLMSCSSSDDSGPQPAIDPTKLKKVVFNQGEVWDFNADGLVTKITSPDISYTFTYDAQNKLTKVVNNTAIGTITHTFTYDASNFISTVDGYPVAYSYGTEFGRYTFEYEIPSGGTIYDDPHRTEIELNSDLLMIGKKVFFMQNAASGDEEIFYPSITASFINGNMAYCAMNESELEYHYQFDTKTNPLRAAVFPAFRAMCLINGDVAYGQALYLVMANSHISTNNVTHEAHGVGSPESMEFTYDYNALNLPVIKTSHLYIGGEPADQYEFAHYYYQGDTLP